MNHDLYVWILTAMGSLEPQTKPDILARHQVLATAIARHLDAEPPLFKDDADKKKTAALMVSIPYRESGLGREVLGDKDSAGRPTSFCAYQVSSGVGGSAALNTDADACVAAGMRVLRWSFRFCPAFPVAGYASGLNGCTNPRAQRISRDRMAIAARLVRDVVVPPKSSFYFPADVIGGRVTALRRDVAALKKREEES